MHAISTVLMSLNGLAFLAGAQAAPVLRGAEAPALRSAEAIADSSWYAQVVEAIRQSEYAFQPVAGEWGVWSAPNRSQELRSRVSTEGIRVFPRVATADGSGAPWTLSLSTRCFGRPGSLRDLDRPRIAADGNRIELDHGVLKEWFENGERGIEHGWTIAARPRGVEPLWIGLAVDGELYLRIDDSARSGVLVDAQGAVQLRYRDLLVFDATGRELPAQLRSVPPNGVGAGNGAAVAIQIDDAGAAYPLTVDPVLTGPAWTAENDQIDSQFGAAVAAAGDVNGDGFSDVIVSAYLYDNGQLDEGRAYAYLGSATGLALTPAWTKEGDQISARFGFAVSTAGDVNGDGYSDVIVGAHSYDNGQMDEGRALVYLGSASGLAASPVWTAEGNQDSAFFGRSVSTAGDVNGDGFSDVVVGAYLYDNGQSAEGRAYVYQGSASGPSATPDWTAESDQAAAFFGIAVSTAGDVDGDGYDDVIVSADAYDNGETDEGRAYLYRGSPFGLLLTPDWTAESDQASALFGISVATAGDVNGDGYGDVIVGAQSYDGGQTDEGRAFVYLGSATGLATSPAWTAEGDQTGAAYGYSVGTAGDVNGDGFSDVIVGVRAYDNGQTDEGRTYAYLGSASGLATSPAWSAESGQPGAFFGTSVATAGDVNGDGYSDVIVGANVYDHDQEDEGRAFTYLGSANGLATASAWSVIGGQDSARYAHSVSTAGDVNGDGFSDVIVGAPEFDNGETNEGRTYAYYGSAIGLSALPDWTAESDQAGAFFGRSVATAGDVNGDGYSDVIVGAPNYDNGETDEGRALVYLGSATGLSASPVWTVESDQAGAEFGNSVSTAGDVNGDGFCDVIVGAHRFDSGQTDEGSAFAYLGGATGLSTSPAWTVDSDQTGAEYGISVSTAGDVNRDGYSDVIVGAWLLDNGQSNEGAAYAYLGADSGLSTIASWTAQSDQIGAAFGFSVATAGDVNGDGFSDVIVGAHTFDGGQVDEGRAYVYLGNSTGLVTSAAWTTEADQAGAGFGYSVSTAGDVNGDGYSDVIVGAWSFENGELNEGRAYAYLGSASGLSTSPSWTAESDQADGNLGISVAAAGDINGDGYGDAIVGASGFDNLDPDEGRAFLYLGNQGTGWTIGLEQRQETDAAPIGLLGLSTSFYRFRAQLGFDPNLAGFTWAAPLAPKARLQWQIATLDEPLGTTAIESGAEQTIAGLPLSFDEIVLFEQPTNGPVRRIPTMPYHWRARIRTNNPIFPVTPWVSIPGNSETELKLHPRRFQPAQPRF